MQRHQRDLARGLVHKIGVTDQRGRFEKRLQRTAIARVLVELLSGRDEFDDVVQPLLLLFVFALAPVVAVVGFGQDGSQQLGHRADRLASQSADQLGETEQRFRRTSGKFGNLASVFGGFDERQLVPICEANQLVERPFADASRRLVDDPQSGGAIGRILDDSQVREHVFDFGSVIKRETGGDLIRDSVAAECLFDLAR